MMWYWGDHMSWWGWVGTSLMMILFWGLVIWAIVTLVRYLSQESRESAGGRDAEAPEQLLARRFAMSEIDESEYVQRLEVLRSSGLAGPGQQGPSTEASASGPTPAGTRGQSRP